MRDKIYVRAQFAFHCSSRTPVFSYWFW